MVNFDLCKITQRSQHSGRANPRSREPLRIPKERRNGAPPWPWMLVRIAEAPHAGALTSSSGHPVGLITMIPERCPLVSSEIWELHHSSTGAIVFSRRALAWEEHPELWQFSYHSILRSLSLVLLAIPRVRSYYSQNLDSLSELNVFDWTKFFSLLYYT